MQHVFIIGSKGIPASYGGYETFVDRLTEEEKRIQRKVYPQVGMEVIRKPFSIMWPVSRMYGKRQNTTVHSVT